MIEEDSYPDYYDAVMDLLSTEEMLMDVASYDDYFVDLL